jgi:hypothetical protein
VCPLHVPDACGRCVRPIGAHQFLGRAASRELDASLSPAFVSVPAAALKRLRASARARRFARFRESALYSEYYRGIGIDHVVALPILVDDEHPGQLCA